MPCLRMVLALLALCGAPSCFADGAIYAFVDGQGELHITNVPEDGRYVALDPPPEPAPPEPAPRETPGTPQPPAPAPARPYGGAVARAAEQFGIEAALLHAVITVESGYNPRAVSKRGAAGLMQLMPQTARRYGVVNVFDPVENIRAGAQYLSDLLKMFGNNLQLALAAYNAGENAVLKYGRAIPPYRETVAYVPRVFEFYQKLRLSK